MVPEVLAPDVPTVPVPEVEVGPELPVPTPVVPEEVVPAELLVVVELGPVLAVVLIEATLPVPLDEVLSAPVLPWEVPDPEESVPGIAQMQLPNRGLVLSNSH